MIVLIFLFLLQYVHILNHILLRLFYLLYKHLLFFLVHLVVLLFSFSGRFFSRLFFCNLIRLYQSIMIFHFLNYLVSMSLIFFHLQQYYLCKFLLFDFYYIYNEHLHKFYFLDYIYYHIIFLYNLNLLVIH